MYLKRLEIQGFKTFPQRTVIEFPTGVTAVVGPNGSGKSNITDAIRWVLGEQSFSALRCRRTDDLIYSGGGKKVAVGMAEVSLTIDNTDRTLPLDFNEVTIMRRSFRSGENDYFLNKSKVRLRDVQEATAPFASSYTLINQGLVDAALTLRPEERRGLFEDAAAISLSVTKRAEAERRLKHTEENLSRVQDLIADIEPRLKILKRQAREAEQVQEVEKALHEALIMLAHLQWHGLQIQLDHAHQQAMQASSHVASAQTEHAQQSAMLDHARQQRTTLQHELDHATATLQEQTRLLEASEREWAIVRERIVALEKRTSETHEQIISVQHEHAIAEQRRAELSANRDQAQTAFDYAQNELREIEQHEHSTLAARTTAEQALEQARERAFAAASAVSEARNRERQLSERIVTLQREHSENQRDLSDVATRRDQAQTALEMANAQRDAAEQALQQAQNDEETAQRTLVALRQQRRDAEEAVTIARREVDNLHSRFEALRRIVADGAGLFTGVKAALQWAENQHDFALVASIIDVPAELETALEVALGARLQNVITPTWDSAEAAINHLKRSDAGRATFLPLDSLRVQRGSQSPKGAGVLGVASDLIRFPERYERAIQHLLGRTLVVEDLATARRVLREIEGNWTIVTLGGEQVNSSGAMTGGAKTREAGTLRRERELRELPIQLDQARSTLTQREHELQTTIADGANAEKRVRETDQARRQARQASEQARDMAAKRQREYERAAQDVNWHQLRTDNAHQEQQNLLAQRDQHQQRIAELETIAAQADAELQLARDAAIAATAASRASDERLAHARAAITSSEIVLKTALETERTHVNSLQRLIANTQQLEQRLTELDQHQHDLHLERDQHEHERAMLQQAVADAHRTHVPLAEQLSAINQTITHAETAERTATQRLLALQRDADTAHNVVTQLETRRDQLWERAAEDNLDIEQIAAQPLPDDVPDQATLQQQAEQLRAKVRRMGVINPLAPQEYAETQERHTFLTTQVDDIRRAADGLRHLINELETAMNARFAATFEAVAEEFSHAFSRLFGGGTAQLVLNDPDSDQGGIEIIAQPPGKRRQALSLLSGGERSLTAVALLVALLKVNPTPFCVMDEVDAALDEANVIRLRELLLEMSERTQFVLVTHNRGTVEIADTLYGVTMDTNGASKVLSLRLSDLVEDESVELASLGIR